MKFEIRNSKSETNSKSKIQNPKQIRMKFEIRNKFEIQNPKQIQNSTSANRRAGLATFGKAGGAVGGWSLPSPLTGEGFGGEGDFWFRISPCSGPDFGFRPHCILLFRISDFGFPCFISPGPRVPASSRRRSLLPAPCSPLPAPCSLLPAGLLQNHFGGGRIWVFPNIQAAGPLTEPPARLPGHNRQDHGATLRPVKRTETVPAWRLRIAVLRNPRGRRLDRRGHGARLRPIPAASTSCPNSAVADPFLRG